MPSFAVNLLDSEKIVNGVKIASQSEQAEKVRN